MTILVVDDAGIMRMILRDILMRYGHFNQDDIFEAADGTEAISKYKEHMPDLVLCDIAMPDMNGMEVVKTLKKFNSDVNIIMCTASTDQEDVRSCLRAGAKDYIIKPPRPERVIQAIEAVIGRKLEAKGGGVEAPEAIEKPVAKSNDEDAGEAVVTRQEFDELKAEVERLKGIVEKLGS